MAPAFAFAQKAQPVPYNPAPSPVPYGQSTSGAQQPSGLRAAAPAGSDVIYLKNGGILRGTIIDAIPNAQARIQLATGEIATVPWSEIARMDHSGTTSSAPAAPTPAPPAAPTKAPPVGPTVHIDSPSPVELQHKGGDSDTWQMVCSSPCDRRLPTDGPYRIVGDGARPSRGFTLPEGAGGVTLNVSPSSQGWFVAGIVFVSVGAPTLLIGLLIGLVASLATTVDNSGTAQDWATGGWTAFGIGTAGVIGGIIAITSNAHTGVEVQTAGSNEGAAGSPWVPVPMWALGQGPHVAGLHDAPPGLQAAPAVGGTLFKLSF
jgi:hypothetical protein